MDGYKITTARLGLRRFVGADINPMVAMNWDAEVMQYFPKPLAEIETIAMMQRIEEHLEKNGFGVFAVEIFQPKDLLA